jgi:hypothetical protein
MAMSHGAPIIVCPLEFERRALLRSGVELPMRIDVSGPGHEGITRWAGANRNPEGPVILAGLAGGLVESMSMGMTVVVDHVLAAGGRRLTPDWDPPSDADCVRAPATSTTRVVTSFPAKGSLHKVTGASLVDLESQTFAQVARDLGWQHGIVRGIGDTLSDPLPPGCDHWVDHRGQTARGQVMRALLRNPMSFRRMRELQRAGEAAMRGVAELLAHAFTGGSR